MAGVASPNTHLFIITWLKATDPDTEELSSQTAPSPQVPQSPSPINHFDYVPQHPTPTDPISTLRVGTVIAVQANFCQVQIEPVR